MRLFLLWLLRPAPIASLPSSSIPNCGTACTISVSPYTLARSGDPLHLEWSVPSNNISAGWIGFFAPPFHSESHDDYIMRFLPESIGASEHTVSLTNVRSQYYDIRYISNETGKCLCRADSKIEFAMGSYEPAQGHVSIDITTGALRVHWVSDDPSPGYVEYKSPGSAEWLIRHASVSTYGHEDMCGVDAAKYYDPGLFYVATLPDSFPEGTEITVRFGSAKRRSRAYTVRVPLKEGSSKTHSVALFGDMGVQGYYRGPDKVDVPSGRWDTYWVVDHLRSNSRLSMALHIGDVSYAMGRSRVWDMFGTAVEEVSMKMPYMVSIGNHEFDYSSGGWHPSWGNFGSDSGGECGIPTKHRYKFPNWWYSFSFGIVRYFMLSSEHDWTEGSEQWKWLNEELSKVNRLITPWVIVTSHRPMLVSAFDPDERAVEDHMYPALGPLLLKHKVNLFVGGHWHYYERTHPVNGTVHVIAGSAGAFDVGDIFEDLERVAIRWPDVRGYLELSISPTQLEGVFWGINDTMADRKMKEFDHFIVLPWHEDQLTIM
ncbi:hypothetical protein FOL47_001624 [Perkinsus chesapeaki]|uniref:Calcineurin-like phosphoesterase domain-containing protein n=1 Tax=Perkinsus chesapeaki TaxID=330153 RepID=A0A7J6N0K4_PERCH|nr:hypothetical protein FOL47_001624 [Perkinsus chesapeaki]